MASRTDPELREALATSERELREPMSSVLGNLFGAKVAASPGFEAAIELTLQFMRGAAFTAILRSNDERQREAIDTWSLVFTGLIEEARK